MPNVAPSNAVQFLGAGLSGLTLAAALRQRDPALLMRIIDPQGKTPRSQSFGYFHTQANAFEQLSIASFNQARVYTAKQVVTIDLHQFPYQIIPASAFQALVYQRLDCAIETDIAEPALASTDLTAIACQQKRVVFDSRPMPIESAPMQQVFFGGEFELSTAIDSQVVTLMDFRIDAGGHIRFIYVVPLAPTRALIQDTWIIRSDVPFDRAHFRLNHQHSIDQHLRHYYQSGVQACIREEHGAIAMGSTAQRATEDDQQITVPIGARAGWLRASTGYSFGETQRAAQLLADWFAQPTRSAPPEYRRPWLSDWMDRVLLRALQRSPDQAPAWFAAMFAHTPTPALVRFLTGQARHSDHLRLMRSLPALPFLRAVLR